MLLYDATNKTSFINSRSLAEAKRMARKVSKSNEVFVYESNHDITVKVQHLRFVKGRWRDMMGA